VRRRLALGRSTLLALVVVVLLVVVAGVFALTLSGAKSSSTFTSRSSVSTTTSTRTATACTADQCAGTTPPTGYNLSQPIGVTYDAANGNVYVTNNFTNSVSVINVASDKLVATVPVGFAPAQSAVDPVNGYVYVTNNDSGTVTVIDGASSTVVTTVQTDGLYPDGIAFDPANDCMYVAEHGNGEGNDAIAVVNATSNTLEHNIASLHSPSGVAYDPIDGEVYVTTGISSVEVVDPATNTIAGQITVGQGPSGIALDPANGYLYVANSISGTVSVINGSSNEVIATVNVSASVVSVPYLVAYDPANGYVMVGNDYSSGVNVINGTANKLLTTVSTGFQSEPAGLAFDPVNGEMYVVGHASYAVVGISPSLATGYLAAPPYATSTATTSSASSTDLD